MINLVSNEKFGIEGIAKHIYINEIIFIGLVVLCLLGDIIGEISDHASIMYWLLMVPIFFLGSIIIEKAQSLKAKKSLKNHLRISLVLWVSAFFSVVLILFLWHSGAILAETVGLIIHIILAHTLFVTGIILGLRFYLLGLFLFVLAGFTIAMEATVGITIMLSILIMVISMYFKKIFM